MPPAMMASRNIACEASCGLLARRNAKRAEGDQRDGVGRPVHQVLRRAEDRSHGGDDDRRVEAKARVDAGDQGVGHRLRHGDRRHSQPGHQVAPGGDPGVAACEYFFVAGHGTNIYATSESYYGTKRVAWDEPLRGTDSNKSMHLAGPLLAQKTAGPLPLSTCRRSRYHRILLPRTTVSPARPLATHNWEEPAL